MTSEGEDFEEFIDDDFEAEDNPDVDHHSGGEDRCYAPGAACGEGDCQNTYNEAEEYWIQLMSAIPKEHEQLRPKPVEGISLPSAGEFQQLVNQVRPQPVEPHTIERIRKAWDSEFASKLTDTPGNLQNKVKALAEGWEGSDFDAFENACNETANVLNEILDNVEEVTKMMGDLEESVSILQTGNGAGAPYPAPQFWTHKKWMGLSQTIHIRPPFWDGDCEKNSCDHAGAALEKAGLDPNEANEVEDYRATRQQYYYDKYNRDGEEPPPGKDPFTMAHARDMAQADANETASQKAEEGLNDYEARYQTVMDDLFERRNMANTEVASFSLPNLQVTPPIDVDPEDMNLGGATPGQPGSQGAPPMGAPSDTLSKPGGTPTSLSPAPAGDHPPTEGAISAPPGLGGDTAAPSTGGNNPWAMPSDPDNENENSDGLLAGGVGGGPGMAGGAGGAAPAAPGIGGAGAGVGAGAGGAGGAGMAPAGARGGLFAPGAGAGGGAGAGAGAGGAGRGGMGSGMGRGAGSGGRMGGMGGGMMGGGRGHGDGDEEDKESSNWLVEDDDVWGLRNPDHEQFN